MGDTKKDDLRVGFDSRLKLKFMGENPGGEDRPGVPCDREKRSRDPASEVGNCGSSRTLTRKDAAGVGHRRANQSPFDSFYIGLQDSGHQSGSVGKHP